MSLKRIFQKVFGKKKKSDSQWLDWSIPSNLQAERQQREEQIRSGDSYAGIPRKRTSNISAQSFYAPNGNGYAAPNSGAYQSSMQPQPNHRDTSPNQERVRTTSVVNPQTPQQGLPSVDVNSQTPPPKTEDLPPVYQPEETQQTFNSPNGNMGYAAFEQQTAQEENQNQEYYSMRDSMVSIPRKR